MESSDLLIIALGVFAYALFSQRGESGSVTGPMVFTLFGLIVGESVLGLVALPVRNEVINSLSEVTLVLVLFTDAARIDISRLDAHHNLPIRLLAIGLPLTMIFGTVVAYLLFPQIGLWPAAVMAVILSPTDAALGQAVVSNKAVPQRIRQALNVESGLNDGLSFPILLIVLSLALESQGGRGPVEWGMFIAGQILLGPLAGIAVGWGGGWLVEYCARRDWMNRVFLQISVLSFAIIAYGGAELIGGNGFIAAFSAGITVAPRSRKLLDAIEDFGETEGQLLSLIVFLLFGALLLPTAFSHIGWRHVLYAVLSLTVIRMLPVALSLIGTKLLPTTVAFVGFFGPRGLASVLYLLLILEQDSLTGIDDISATVLLTVLLSVLVHGATAAPGARAYGRHLDSMSDENTAPERRPVFPFPTRIGHHREHKQPAEVE